MRRFSASMAISLAALATLAAESRAAVLYDSTTPTTGAGQNAYLVRPHVPANSGDTNGTGAGDDYITTASQLDVTGVSFVGSVGSLTNLFVNFYDANQNLVTTVAPNSSQISASGSITTIASSAFGSSGVVVPGTGYVIFSITPQDTTTPTRPSLTLYYETGIPTVGTNNATSGARLDYQGNFQTFSQNALVFPGAVNTPANVAEIQLTGTAVPEPTSLTLLAAPLAMAFRRRRA